MKWLIAVLFILLCVLQYKLWLGKGGYLEVKELEKELTAQKELNKVLSDRNKSLEAEVQDLKQGLAAIEERAREELGMIREGETLYQVVPKRHNSSDGSAANSDE